MESTVTAMTFAEFLSMGGEFLTAILSWGLQIITFITSHWLLLMTVLLFVIIAVFGVIRRLYA